jgi:uncharacterized delta-60 repeat protein
LPKPSDGKILAAGSYASSFPYTYHVALVRYTSEGIPDTAFGTNGVVTTTIGATDDEALGMALQSDGKIVAVGYSDVANLPHFSLVRYASDGSLDATFGAGGKLTVPVGAGTSQACGVGIQSDHKIVVAGTATTSGTDKDFAVIRVRP